MYLGVVITEFECIRGLLSEVENLESERVNFSSTLFVMQCERNNFQSF